MMRSVNWKKAKSEYVTKDRTLEQISKKYKVSMRTVEWHSAREGWVSEKREYLGRVAEKYKEKTAETFAEYAKEMQGDIIKIHRMLMERINQTLTFDEPFSPRDLKSLSSMLVDLMSNYERMASNRNGEDTGKIVVEFVNGYWDDDST